jgi:phosphoglycerol transferase
MSDAPIPDYLFYWLFSATNACGPYFYQCGKVINVIALVAMAAVLFVIARKVSNTIFAWVVSIGLILSPVSIYASFFMPEILFFLAISILVLFMLRIDESSPLKTWFGLGLGLGIAALTKPHALFFGAVIGAYAIYLSKTQNKLSIPKAVSRTAAAAIGSIVSKFTLGLVFAGTNGLTLFGSSYTGTLSLPQNSPEQNFNPTQSQQGLQQLFEVLGGQIWGHVMALCFLFAAPIAIGIQTLRLHKSDYESDSRKKLALISLASAATGIVTISLFSALVTVNGSDHSTRIMLRYYDYITPLMYILLALGAMSVVQMKTPLKIKVALIAPVMVSFVAVILNFGSFKLAFYDGTTLTFAKESVIISWVLVALTSLSVFGAIFSKQVITKVASIGLLLALTLTSSVAGASALEPLKNPDRFDYAAEFAKSYLSEDELAQLTVISHEDYALARSLLLLDNSSVDYRVIQRGETFGAKYLSPDKEWVLLIGNTFIDQQGCLRQQGNGYVLVKLCSSPEFYFNQTLPTDLISSVKGIAYPEDWGSWTVGKTAIVNFATPVPANAKIQLTMAAPSFNSDQKFSATLGGSTIEFELGQEPIDANFEFQNSAPSTQLVITIPAPKSEKSEGLSQNTREVGIMLYKIKVIN